MFQHSKGKKESAPVHAKIKLVGRPVSHVINRIWVPSSRSHIFVDGSWFHFRRLNQSNSRTVLHALIRPSRIRSWRSNGTDAITSATRLGTGQTRCWRGRTETWAWQSDPIINCCYLLFPLLETKVTYPNPLTIFSDTFWIIRWRRDWVCSTLSTKNTPTETAVVLAVEECELRITFITYPTAIIRHPKVPWDIRRLSSTREPGFHYIQ